MLSVLSREYLLVFHVVFIVYCLFVVLRLGSEVGILCFALACIGAEVSAMRITSRKRNPKNQRSDPRYDIFCVCFRHTVL